MKKHFHQFLLLAGFFMFITSCTKNDTEQPAIETPVVKLTNEWLNSRIKEGSAARNARIEVLRQHILPAQSFTETLEDGEKLIIVPIAKEFKMNTNSDKDADHYLLLFENSAKEVYKGNIVQFIPLNTQQRNLPKNTLSRLWNCENVTANGTFTVLTIFDKHLYEVDFNKGVKTRYAELQKGSKKNNVQDVSEAAASTVTCVEWYRETTYYYSDGSSYTTEDYLGTTCYNNCGPTTEVCEPRNTFEPDGGSSEVDPDLENEATKTVTWNVYNPYGPANPNTHSYGVNAIETIKGKRNSSAPQGGYFIKMWHNTSECNTCPQTIGVYVEDSYTVEAQRQTATSRVTGHYSENGQRKNIDGSNAWEFKNVFK